MRFCSGNSVLSNGLVFLGLLVLTVVTTLPKLTKVTKPLAQAIDQVEGYSGIIAVLLVQAAASFGRGGGGQEVVYQAGIFSMTLSTLLMAVSVVNIFVINTVKFFFEVMVLLSPFPAVDAAFEAANKAFAAALLGIYAYSPALATAAEFHHLWHLPADVWLGVSADGLLQGDLRRPGVWSSFGIDLRPKTPRADVDPCAHFGAGGRFIAHPYHEGFSRLLDR